MMHCPLFIQVFPSNPLPHQSPRVSAWEARQHVSPYSLTLCRCGKSILNKPSDGFLCYTFHFHSSKLQGKLACQVDDGEQAVEESNIGVWRGGKKQHLQIN